MLHANERRDGSLLGKLELCKSFTINILTSCRLRTSSTSARGFPLGTGMVPRMEQLEASSVCLTARINAWLNSSIFPISSMTNSLLLPSRICSIIKLNTQQDTWCGTRLQGNVVPKPMIFFLSLNINRGCYALKMSNNIQCDHKSSNLHSSQIWFIHLHIQVWHLCIRLELVLGIIDMRLACSTKPVSVFTQERSRLVSANSEFTGFK